MKILRTLIYFLHKKYLVKVIYETLATFHHLAQFTRDDCASNNLLGSAQGAYDIEKALQHIAASHPVTTTLLGSISVSNK